MSDHLIVITEFSNQICASTRTARRILKRGELPSYRVGGKVLVRQSEVDHWLENHRIERRSEPSDLKSALDRAIKRARERRGLI